MSIAHEDESDYTPARVHVVRDDTKITPGKPCYRSTLKSYSIDNVNQPVVLLAPYNAKRYKCRITTNDTSCVLTMDNPGNTTIVSAAATAPQGNSIMIGTMGNGFDGYEIYGPDNIYAQSVQGNAVTRVNIIQTFYVDEP